MVVQFVTRQHEPDVTVMDFTGQLTWGNSLVEAEYAIKDRIRGGSRKLVLDLTNVNFLDSAGVGMLVVCSSVMQQAGGRLVVAGAAGKVKHVLELTRIDKVIGIYPDLPSACGGFAGQTVLTNLASIPPILAAGLLADKIGVTPVFFLMAVLVAALAAYFAARNQAMPARVRR